MQDRLIQDSTGQLEEEEFLTGIGENIQEQTGSVTRPIQDHLVLKKQVYKKSQEGTYTEVGNWTSGWTANGYRMIRYADLLLMIAECQIEARSLAGARTNINQVRARAANPAGFVMDGADPAANYVINQYPAAGAPFDTKANAHIALRMERKLELGQEGHRWFDLNRWGITVTELNRVLTYEKTHAMG